MTDEPGVILSEQVSDVVRGSYREDWYCQPPAADVEFHVIRSDWTPDHSVRRIYEIRIGSW